MPEENRPSPEKAVFSLWILATAFLARFTARTRGVSRGFAAYEVALKKNPISAKHNPKSSNRFVIGVFTVGWIRTGGRVSR